MNLKEWKLQLVFVIYFYCSTFGAAEDAGKHVVCFHEIDTVGMRDQTRFSLENFDSKLCTHLVYSTIRLDIERNQILKQSHILKNEDRNFKLMTALREKNPQLKFLTILNLNTAVNLDEKQREIMNNGSHVDNLAKIVVTALEENKFDGVFFDLLSSHDKKNGFINIIQSLKKAFLPKEYTLAYYIGYNNEDTIDEGYDITKLSENVDLLILEGNNFYAPTIESAWADHHAPLYNRPWDTENKTVDSLVSLWISKGFPANKILFTIPLWGNSWKLSTINETSPPAPANGKGAPGRLTSRRGILGYFEICENINKNNWQVFQDEDKRMGPYAVSPPDGPDPINRNRTWVGYDDPATAVNKSEYIKEKGLGGAAVKDIWYDDIDDSCGGGKYPILSAIHKTLSSQGSNEQLTLPFWIITCIIIFSVLLLIAVVLVIIYRSKFAGRTRERTNSQIMKLNHVAQSLAMVPLRKKVILH